MEIAGDITVDIDGACYARAMMDFERQYLIHILQEANLNKRVAAKRAGLGYSTFCKKIAALNLKFKIVVEE